MSKAEKLRAFGGLKPVYMSNVEYANMLKDLRAKHGKPRSVCDTERDRRAGKDPMAEECCV